MPKKSSPGGSQGKNRGSGAKVVDPRPRNVGVGGRDRGASPINSREGKNARTTGRGGR